MRDGPNAKQMAVLGVDGDHVYAHPFNDKLTQHWIARVHLVLAASKSA
jgi:hypothetical protein